MKNQIALPNDSGARLLRQKGTAMVISLFAVAAVSVLAIAGMQDSNTQTNMVRNEQLQSNAYQVAISEINAQIDFVNSNESDESDPLIDTVMGQTLEQPLPHAMRGPDAGGGAYQQGLTIAFICDSCPGYDSSMGSVKLLKAEINSTANLASTNSSSDQSQGIEYFAAGGSGNIVSW